MNHKWLAQFPEMAEIMRRYGKAEPQYRPAGLASLILIILEQQISVKAARTQFRNLRKALGGISGQRLRNAGEPGLRLIGLTRQKSRYCYELGCAVAERRFSVGALARLDDQDAFDALTALPGIGPWSASIYLMMSLRRPDIWPTGDLALKRAVAELLDDIRANQDDGVRWTPNRSHAAFYLWHYYRNSERLRG